MGTKFFESWHIWKCLFDLISVQFSSVTQSCLTLCDPMNHSTPGLPVHHQLPESTQTHGHCVRDAIQSSHPLSSPSPPALNLSQHHGLFKRVSSSHQVAKVLEFQLQNQSYQWTPRKQRLNRVNIIFQPVDLCLLSPAVSAYTATRSVLVSRLTSTCQPLDQHLSAAW